MVIMPDYYEFYCPVKIVSGKKALANLPYEMDLLGSKKAMVITDQGVVNAGLLKLLEEAFQGWDGEIGALYDQTPPDSSDKVVNEIARTYREKGCDCIVAVGGGSSIDTAKGVNIVVTEGTEDLLAYQGVERLKNKTKPFIVIPTTAGTGSEATSAAVITNTDKGIKMSITSYQLIPDTAILDPKMTRTMPPKITAATGMDALTHAVEAYYCLQKNPVSDAFSVGAIRLIVPYLIKAVEDGKDEKARMAMANGALLAGISFSNSLVGVVHTLAHATGGVAHVPHGVANSIFLPWGLEYNLEKSDADMAELAPFFGKAETGNARKDAEAVIAAVREIREKLYKLCELPRTLKEAGVEENKLEEIAGVAINDGTVAMNPEEVAKEDALNLLKKAYG